MKMKMIGVLALGCASMVGIAGAKAQGTDQDKQFLMTASQGDYTEITFSKLALSKSNNPQVKSYAQQMITDHNKLEDSMKPFANQMGIQPVMTLDPMHQQKYDQLSSLSGADFDKQYMSDMDTDHHSTLDAFKAELSSTSDAQIKPTVKKGEKVVAQHTQMADKLSAQLGNPSNGM